MTGDKYDRAAEWAEHEMELPADSASALRRTAAADFGRELVERARGGRPSIDPEARPGQRSPVRQVRLPRALDADLVAFAKRSRQKPSEVLREALREYLAAHRAAG